LADAAHQVAEFAAVTMGLVIVLWLGRQMSAAPRAGLRGLGVRADRDAYEDCPGGDGRRTADRRTQPDHRQPSRAQSVRLDGRIVTVAILTCRVS